MLGSIAFTHLDRIADIGCDLGQMAIEVAPSVQHVTGVEAEPAKLENARVEAQAMGLGNAVFQKGTLALPGLAPESCSKVLSALALHRVAPDEQREAFNAMTAVIKPGGELYLADIMDTFGQISTQVVLDRFASLPEASSLRQFADELLAAFADHHPVAMPTLIEWGLAQGLSFLGFGGTNPVLGWLHFAKPRTKTGGVLSLSEEMRAVEGPSNKPTASEATRFDFDRY